MAVKDNTREGLHNRKRSPNNFVALDILEADIVGSAEGVLLGRLPKGNVLVKSVTPVIKTVSGTASSLVQITIGANTIKNNVAATSAVWSEAISGGANRIYTTGGDIIVKAGATAPATGSLVMHLIVEYVELDKVGQEYTD